VSNLIESVARKAGWTWYDVGEWCDAEGERMTYPQDTLEPAGLLLLLKELLAAGWHFGKEGDRFIAATTASRTAGYVFHFGPTLEEAAMLAYLAMDDAHKGEP